MAIDDILPKSWRQATISDVSTVTMGQAPTGSSYNLDCKGVPLIAGAADLGVEYPQPTKWTTSPSQTSQPGDIIYCIRATIGLMNWSDGKYCLGRGVAGIGPHTETIDPYFLAFWLRTLTDHFLRRATGSTFVQIRRQDIESAPIPLPPLPEQRRIVAILRQADELRQLRRRANTRAKDLLPALFYEMFGEHGTVKQARGTTCIAELGEVSYGLTVNQQRRNAANTHSYLRVANVHRWELDLSDVSQIGTLDGDVEKYRLRKGDVLVVEGHADPAQLGRAAIWDDALPECLHQNHLLRIRPFADRSTPHYLVGFINSIAGQQYMLRYGKTSSGLNTINSTVLAKMPIPEAPIEAQLEFEKRYAKFRELSRSTDVAATTSEVLFQSLLASAFTGELTAGWRAAHAEELATAAAERDRLLRMRRDAQPQQRPAATTPAAVTHSFANLTAVVHEIARSQQKIIDQMTPVFKLDLPDFTALADSLRPTLILMPDVANDALKAQIVAINDSALDSMVQAAQPLADLMRSQQAYYADFLQKLAQVARIELDDPITRGEIEAEVLETAAALPAYFTLHDLANHWRLNHLARHAVEEAVEMLVVWGKLRPAILKLESADPVRPYDLVDAYALVAEANRISAAEIEL